MYRPIPSPPPFRSRHSWQDSFGRLLAPLTVWILVSVTLRYGFYADCRMVLGPSSSRLMKASSVFVKQIEVRDDEKKGVILYGYSEKPELVTETNWSVSNYMIVASYSRKGFSLWLNKGSRIRMRWETQTSILNQLQVVMIKGEGKYETVMPTLKTPLTALNLTAPTNGKVAEYTIEEDDKFYIGLVNTNAKSIIMAVSLNVTSKMYDLSKARTMCSTIKGSCRLRLGFPNTQYVLVTTPDNGDTSGWYIELSFVARIVTYAAVLGFIVLLVYLMLKYLGACEGESSSNGVETTSREISSETTPIMSVKPFPSSYGSNEKDDDAVSSSSSSSEDLYDAKLCVICYDEQRNCFFVPCGHCATCYDCSQRIMEEDNRMCPICRRLIHKVKRLFTP